MSRSDVCFAILIWLIKNKKINVNVPKKQSIFIAMNKCSREKKWYQKCIHYTRLIYLYQLHRKAYRPFTSLSFHPVNKLMHAVLYCTCLNKNPPCLKGNEINMQSVNLKQFIVSYDNCSSIRYKPSILRWERVLIISSDVVSTRLT